MTGFHAVVLAGGAASRFGGGKLIAPFRGGVLVDQALAAALAAPVEGVILVTGADAALVSARSKGLARVRVVHAADHAEGMAATLRAGVAALPPGAEGVLVFLGDMPDIPADAPPRLIDALRNGANAAVPMFDGRRGHPGAFAATLFPQLLALSGDRGARLLLDGLGPGLVHIAASGPGVLADVDTPDDLRRLERAGL